MDGDWPRAIPGILGVLFAFGGTVGAFLQAKRSRDQHKELQRILELL